MKADTLHQLILQIETNIPHFDIENKTISEASIGWHLAHSLLTINGIIEVLKKSNPTDYKWKFKKTKLFVFAFNKIPRGKGKAPNVVMPKAYDIETIEKLLNLAKVKFKELEIVPSAHFFTHPYFGDLKKAEAIKFLCIHTKHHLQIVDEILSN